MFQVEGLNSPHFSAPISLTVRKGEILGITGLVGSGKTELARALFGVDRWSEGTAQINGESVHIQNPGNAIRLGIGYLPKDRDSDGLCLNRSVKENVSLVSLAKMRGLFFSPAAEKRTVSKMVDSIRIKTRGPVPSR